MISKEDLRAAVGSGLLTEAQAASLQALAHSRSGAREGLREGDEPFELFKGFNEIFIVIGLIILASGWVAFNGLSLIGQIGGFQDKVIWTALLGAGILWVLAEYFIRRRRMVAPAIALSILFAGNAGAGLGSYFAEPFMIAQQDYSSLSMPLGLTTLSIFVFWLRFKVPFAMALIALGCFTHALLLAGLQAGAPEQFSDLFLLSANGPFALVTLVLGLVVFGIAMWFDLSDPHRVTRRSAQGFWLHVVAAPALVNTIALSLMNQETGSSDLLLLGVLALFAFVAIVIDRRSFLIAAIGYIVTLASTVFDSEGTAMTVLALGIFLVALGAFWTRIRAGLLSLLSGVLPIHRLPPSH